MVLFLTMGQSLSDFPTWFGRSTELAGGYSSAMADLAGFSGARYWLLLSLVLGAVVFGGWAFWRVAGRRSFPALVLGMATAWFAIKTGYVRLDPGHAAITFSRCRRCSSPCRGRVGGLPFGGVATRLALLSIWRVGSTEGPGEPSARVVEHPSATLGKHFGRPLGRSTPTTRSAAARDAAEGSSVSVRHRVPGLDCGKDALRVHRATESLRRPSSALRHSSAPGADLPGTTAVHRSSSTDVNREGLRNRTAYVLHRRMPASTTFPAWTGRRLHRSSFRWLLGRGGRTHLAGARSRSQPLPRPATGSADHPLRRERVSTCRPERSGEHLVATSNCRLTHRSRSAIGVKPLPFPVAVARRQAVPDSRNGRPSPPPRWYPTASSGAPGRSSVYISA